MSVPRGTTPTFVLTFPATSGVDLTQATNVYVTFCQGAKVLTKSGADITVEERSVSVYLSQEETLGFSVGPVEIQVNWTMSDGSRAASEISTYQLTRQLLQKVIE